MRSQADLLYNEQNCYSEQNSVEENCTFDQYTACRDGGITNSGTLSHILCLVVVTGNRIKRTKCKRHPQK